MTKKFMFAMLAAVLTAGVVTGCGKVSGNSGSSGKSEKSEEKASMKLDMERIAADEARGIKFSDDKRTLIKYNRQLKDSEYTIPDGVTTIGDGAFFHCDLTSVTIPSSVTVIGKEAFMGGVKLTGVTIPSSVTSIGEGAFAECAAVKVASGNSVFYNDASGALIDRKRKIFLYLPRDFSGAYTIPSGVTGIGDLAFFSCMSLTSVTIPDGVTTIGKHAFRFCHKLVSVTIPDGVTTIGESAFFQCISLTRVTIPSSVTSIGHDAFSWCPCERSVKRQFTK